MKSILLIILFNLLILEANSQTYDWVWARNGQSSGSTSGAEGYNVASDKSGNVFITGYYIDSISFGSYVLPKTAPRTAYLTKYDENGNVKWAKAAITGGVTGAWGSEGNSIATDNSGNSYLTGYFSDTAYFGTHMLVSAGTTNAFLAKYDSSGNVVWAKKAGGTGNDYGYGVATDASGNVYLTGRSSSTVFTIGAFILANTNLFIAKYDSSGNVLWANGAVGFGYGNSIATDALANVYIAGQLGGTLTVGSYTLTATGGNDILLAKYDSSGNVLWAEREGGSGSEFGTSVATDASNNIYITGYYNSAAINFGPYTVTNAGLNDVFLAKYNPSGNVLWAKTIGNSGDDKGYSVTTDMYAKVYLSGGSWQPISPSLTFDTITLPLGNLEPMFIACYDSSGRAKFAKALSHGGDDNNAVAVSADGCIYVGSDFAGTSFTLGTDTMINPNSFEVAFVAKLCYSGVIAHFTCSDTAFCNESGKCINFYDHSTGNPTSWHWHFSGATPDSSNQQNPDSICYYNTGTYPVSLIVSNGSTTDTLTVSPLIIFGSSVAAPTIAIKGGDTLVSSHGGTYQWFLNGSPITGATDSFYVEHQNGTYSVQISDATGGCHALSNGVTVGIEELSGDGNISIYPNPASQSAIISWLPESAAEGIIELSIINVLGDKVYEGRIEAGSRKQITVNCKSFASGVYFVKVADKKMSRILKFVKE